MKKRKLKLKPKAKKQLLVVGAILGILFLLLGFFQYQQSLLKKEGYSAKAIVSIFKKGKLSYAKALGENKTVNAAFESKDYEEKNLASYEKITYQKQKNLIKNINTLLKKGYKETEISLILSRGNDGDVSSFAKRERVKYLEEFFSIKYAKLAYYDRYVAYQDKENEDAELTVLYVNMDFDKEPYQDVKVIDTFDKTVLVNKHRQLSEDFVPSKLTSFAKEDVKGNDTIKAQKEVVSQFEVMAAAAKKEGLSLLVNSGYRSYKDQQEMIETYRTAYGDNYVEKYMIPVGYSEHQTGMSIDVASANKNVFLESDEYQWMMDHAYEYGFILRYPKSKEDITAYQCEPWHYRYVGKKAAAYIKKHNLTYDEYYVMFLDK